MPTYYTDKISDIVDIRMGEGLASYKPITVPKSFLNIADSNLDHVALVTSDNVNITFREYRSDVMRAAKSFKHLGLKLSDSINIIGFNSTEYAISFFAGIFAGGISVGVYSTNTPNSCLFNANLSNSKFIIVDGHKQLDKYLEIIDKYKPIAFIMYNHENIPKPKDISVPLYYWDEFLQIGHDVPDSDIYDIIDSQQPGQCCSMIFTSGTTGNPKIVLLSHDNYVFSAYTAALSCMGYKRIEDIPKILSIYFPYRIVSYLPLNHVAAQVVDLCLHLIAPITVYYAKPDALRGSLLYTLQTCKPIIQLGVPRVWEKMKDVLEAKLNKNMFVKPIMKWAMTKGRVYSSNDQYSFDNPQSNKLFVLANFIFKKIKVQLGFSCIHACFSSAAPIHRDIVQFFGDLTIPVYELYGSSECCGPISSNSSLGWKMGTVGRPCVGVSIKLSKENNEVLIYGRNVFMGYLNNLKATQEVMDENGYFRSGDLGSIDNDGFLTITGRCKELIITAGGENVTPLAIEDIFKSLVPSISNIVVIGDKLKFLSLIMTFKTKLDKDGNPNNEMSSSTHELAKEIGSHALSINEIPKCPKFSQYIQSKIDHYNKNLAVSQAQNIRKWTILGHDFGQQTGELTSTLKLRRGFVCDRYDNEIKEMYRE